MRNGSVSFLPKDEWERVKKSTQEAVELERKRQEERLKLREMSQARVANWTNTLDGIRMKRIKEREERMKRDEEERKRMDEEEAAYQEEQRRKVIERADKLLLQDDDRVRKQNSKLLLEEVMKERKMQLEVKAKRQQ
jgi:membrane protein involved in colicin uptake